jgi:hypothetical protein
LRFESMTDRFGRGESQTGRQGRGGARKPLLASSSLLPAPGGLWAECSCSIFVSRDARSGPMLGVRRDERHRVLAETRPQPIE